MPAGLIGTLVVVERWQRCGLGTWLMDAAAGLCSELSRAAPPRYSEDARALMVALVHETGGACAAPAG